MSKKKFTQIWKSQTELGKQFGLSAIAVGKKLKEWGLKDPNNAPSAIALSEGYAISTPLKDGTPYFMWNKDKVKEKFNETGLTQLSAQAIRCKDFAVALIGCEKESQKGNDKMAYLMQDSIYDEMKPQDKPLVNHYLQELGSDLRVD